MADVKRISPTEAIQSLDSLMAGLNTLQNNILDASHEAAVQWAGLTRVGGGREDHAAKLLEPLEVRIARMRDYCDRVHKQLWAAICDPFGEENP